ncbi:MAG: hypothetical protein AAF182_03945 [Pseudomonadota bacterium]
MGEEKQDEMKAEASQSPLANKRKVSRKMFIKIIVSFFLLAFVMILMGTMAYIKATM